MNGYGQPLYRIFTFVYSLYDRKEGMQDVSNTRCAAISIISNNYRKLNDFRCFGTAVALPSGQTINPNMEGRKMRTDGQTIRGNETDMGKVKVWAQRTFSRERIALTTAKLVVAGYLGIVLAQVLMSY
jgi:hypothetical protein